jgi:hypothetical protein
LKVFKNLIFILLQSTNLMVFKLGDSPFGSSPNKS